MKSRILTINALHGNFEEFGVSLLQGTANVDQSVSICEYPGSELPATRCGTRRRWHSQELGSN